MNQSHIFAICTAERGESDHPLPGKARSVHEFKAAPREEAANLRSGPVVVIAGPSFAYPRKNTRSSTEPRLYTHSRTTTVTAACLLPGSGQRYTHGNGCSCSGWWREWGGGSVQQFQPPFRKSAECGLAFETVPPWRWIRALAAKTGPLRASVAAAVACSANVRTLLRTGVASRRQQRGSQKNNQAPKRGKKKKARRFSSERNVEPHCLYVSRPFSLVHR